MGANQTYEIGVYPAAVGPRASFTSAEQLTFPHLLARKTRGRSAVAIESDLGARGVLLHLGEDDPPLLIVDLSRVTGLGCLPHLSRHNQDILPLEAKFAAK